MGARRVRHQRLPADARTGRRPPAQTEELTRLTPGSTSPPFEVTVVGGGWPFASPLLFTERITSRSRMNATTGHREPHEPTLHAADACRASVSTEQSSRCPRSTFRERDEDASPHDGKRPPERTLGTRVRTVLPGYVANTGRSDAVDASNRRR